MVNPMPNEKAQNLPFEAYKLYLATAERVSDRRAAGNSWMLSLNTAVSGLYGYLKSGEVVTSNNMERSIWLVTIPMTGILLCFAWVSILSSYRNLNNAKFKVIHELEKKLEIDMFAAEQRFYTSAGRKPLSKLERRIPFVFMIMYFALIVGAFYGAFF